MLIQATKLSCFLFLVVPSVAAVTSDEEHQRPPAAIPNIVYIMADDMGYGDVKCFGQGKSRAQTPHIDALARSGVMFTDAHAPVSHCIPTRVAVMTGRYQFRFARQTQHAPWGFLFPQIPSGQLTLATLLKRAGYHTGYIGKWHLGLVMNTRDGKPQGPHNVDYEQPVTQGPNDHGFDESFILPGSLDMFPYVFACDQKWLGPVNSKKGWSAFNRVGPAADDFEDYKVLDRFGTEAESFIEKQATGKSPFFLYVALTSPHTPTSPSPAFKGKSRLGLYGDFLMETDHCVGRIVQALDRHRLRKNTIVIFTSDHGAANYAGNTPKATVAQNLQMEKLGHYSNGIYRGHKFSVYEGGTRVPLVVSWPGNAPPKSECNGLVGLNDMMATFAAIAGVQLRSHEAPDSQSFLNLIQSPESNAAREFMICRSTNHFTVREGRWKLALCPGSGCAGRWGNQPPRDLAWKKAVQNFGRRPLPKEIHQPEFCQLFDLKNDPGESQNLALQHPDRIIRLKKILDQAISRGRSTPGPKLTNDRKFNLVADVPRFVLAKELP